MAMFTLGNAQGANSAGNIFKQGFTQMNPNQSLGISPPPPSGGQTAPNLGTPVNQSTPTTNYGIPNPGTLGGTSTMPANQIVANSYNGGGYTGFGNSQVAPGSGGNTTDGGSGSGTPNQIPNAVPIGMYTNQASQLNPNTMQSQVGKNFANKYNASHQLMNLTPDAFNSANKLNSETAFQMLQQGGQPFINAVMKANGWNQQQMNEWLDQVAYENSQTFNRNSGSADTMAKFGAQYAQPTHFGSQGYATGFTGPQQNALSQFMTDYHASPTYGGPRPDYTAPVSVNKGPVVPPPHKPVMSHLNSNLMLVNKPLVRNTY